MVVGEPGVAPRQQGPVHGSARERAGFRQAGWHRRRKFRSCPSKQSGTGVFSVPHTKKEDNTMIMSVPYKTYLEESQLPKAWYNLRADM